MGCTSSKFQAASVSSSTWISQAPDMSRQQSIHMLPPEILREILGYSGTVEPTLQSDNVLFKRRYIDWTKQMVHLALCCSAFAGPALEILWRSVTLTSVVRLLPTRRENGVWVLDGPIDMHTSRVVMAYSQHIQSLIVDPDVKIHFGVINELAQMPVGTSLLSGISNLRWHFQPAMELVPTLAHIICTDSIKKLSLDFDLSRLQQQISNEEVSSRLSDLFDVIGTHPPHLQHFSVSRSVPADQDFMSVLASFVERQTSIRSIEYRFPCDLDYAPVMQRMLGHGRLTSACFSIFGVTVKMKSDSAGFGGPTSISFRGNVEDIVQVLSIIPVVQLTTLTVEGGFVASISQQSWTALADVVFSHFGEQINTLTLLPYVAHVPEWNQIAPINIQNIVQPWFAFDGVSHFNLNSHDMNCQLHAYEHDIRNLATAWPLLEQLHIGLHYEQFLPINVLYTVAYACPQLKSLNLPVGGLFVAPSRPFNREHGLEYLNHQGRITSSSVYDDLRKHVFSSLPEVDGATNRPY